MSTAQVIDTDLVRKQPRDWMERLANVKELYRHDNGGHFPAINNPTQWVADALDFFGKYA